MKTLSLPLSMFHYLVAAMVGAMAFIGLPPVAFGNEYALNNYFAAPVLRLDPSNVTGAGGTNINTVACANGYEILEHWNTGTSASVSADRVIQSMSIVLENPQDAGMEELAIGGIFPGVLVSGNGSTELTLTNNGSATTSAMLNVLNDLLYKNNAASPNTVVQRRVLITVTDALGQRSNTATAFVTVTRAANTGNSPGPILVFASTPTVDLYDGLDGSQDVGGTWVNVATNAPIAGSTVNVASLPMGGTAYRYEVDAGGACGVGWTTVVVVKIDDDEEPITSANSCGFFLTTYTNAMYSAGTDDPIYVFNGGPSSGSLSGTSRSVGTVFDWYKFDAATNSYEAYALDAGPTISGLESGGYLLLTNNGGVIREGRAWVWNTEHLPSIDEVGTVCEGAAVTLNGDVGVTTQHFTYYDPVRRPFIINASTRIRVTFNAVHTYVSDLAFYFVNPDGTKTIPLGVNQGGNCNSGDNVNNLTFTNQGPNAYFNFCGAATPLTGTFNGYRNASGQNQLIDWSLMYGENANAGGWKVQIYDCVGQDVGSLRGATISFDDGAGNVVTYASGSINVPINDNSCSPSTASIYTVPFTPAVLAPTAITIGDDIGIGSGQGGYQWSYSTDGPTGPFVDFENGTTTPQLSFNETTWIRLSLDLGIEGCLLEDMIEVTVNTVAAPTGSANQEFCVVDNPTLADIAVTGAAIRWYADAYTTTALASSTALVDGTTYYASQTVDGCEGVVRLPITVGLFEQPTVDAGEDITQYTGPSFELDASNDRGVGEWSIVSSSPAGLTSSAIDDVTDPNATITLPANSTATLRWTVTNGGCVVFDDVELTYLVPEITVTKTANVTEVSAPGIINYELVVENTGTVNLTSITVADAVVQGTSSEAIASVGTPVQTGGTGDNTDGVLDVGETWTYNYSYTVTQAHLDDGGDLVNGVSVDASELTAAVDDDATVTLTQSPSLTVAKTADVTTVSAPGAINYELVIENTGNVSLTGITITDGVTQGTFSEAIASVGMPVQTGGTGDNTDGVLDVGETWTYNYSYTVTQAHLDDGGDLVNGVSVDASELTAAVDDDATATLTQSPSLTVAKMADVATVSAPGAINYELVIENTGNVSLTGIAISDEVTQGTSSEAIASLGTPVQTGGTGDNEDGVLDVGETWTYNYSYTVTQAHLDNGGDLVNGVSVDASELTAAVDDDATVTLTQSPSLTVTKKADVTTVSAPGAINYELVIENTGNVSLTDIAISDEVTQGISSEAIASLGTPVQTGGTGDNEDGVLDVGETWTYNYSYTVTQAHLDDGGDLVNGVSVDASELTAAVDDDATVTVTQSPSLTVTKTADVTTVSAPGSIGYEVIVENTGNVSLTGIAISDEVTQGISSEAIASLGTPVQTGGTGDNTDGVLDVGETWTYNYSYTVTQAHLDNGSDLVNGVSVDASELTAAVNDDATVTLTQSPSLTVTKTADVTTVSAPGSIGYEVIVENTGNVSLTGITVTDGVTQGTFSEVIASLGTPVQTGGTGDNTDGVLDVGETWTYNYSYTVTQAHLDNGSDLVNGVSVDASELTAAVDDDATVTVTQSPSLTVTKTADVTTVSAPGSIGYEVIVENTGNVSLTGIVVTDGVTQGTSSEAIASVGMPVQTGGAGDNTDGVLDVGETWTYNYSYTVTQAHLDNGSDLVNGISVDASELTAAVDDDATVTVTQSPSLTVAKTADVASVSAPGAINYELVIENTGNVSLTGIAISDEVTQGTSSEAIASLGTPVQTGGTGDNEDGVLDVGETWTYNYSYTVTQAHLDNGSDLVNGVSVDASELTASVDDDATVTVTQSPSLAVAKSADVTMVSAPGAINYELVIENTGNVSLTGITVTDGVTQGTFSEVIASLGTPVQTGGTGDNTDGVLDVGETWTYNYSYTVTQAHLDNGGDLVNGVSVDASELTAAVDDDATVTVTQSPSLTVAKTADVATVSAPGAINYELVIENTGNVSLTGIAITDGITQGTFSEAIASVGMPVQTGGTGDNTDGVLDVGETWTYNYSYTVTQAHLDNGGDLVNGASVDASELTGAVDDDATVTVTQSPSFTLIKVLTSINGDSEATSFDTVGDVLEYTITVTNTGNVTLGNIVVSDALTGLSETVSVLVPGADSVLTTRYAIRQSDLDAGSVLNRATATGEDPAGNPVDPTDPTSGEETTSATRTPSFTINKVLTSINGDSEATSFDTVGDVLEYTITVTNTGNVTLANIVVSDALTGLSETVSVLVPGADSVLTTRYAIRQSDLDAGSVLNRATATGEDPAGNPVDPTDPTSGEETTSATQRTGLSLTKKVISAGPYGVGSDITYQIVATNTGNVTLTDVNVTDDNAEIVSGPPIDSLQPGAATNVIARHTITQADADAGQVINQARATAKAPDGTVIPEVSSNDPDTPGEDDATVITIIQTAEIRIEKHANRTEVKNVGDEVVYEIRVTNTGNVTLHNVEIRDPLTGFVQQVAKIEPGMTNRLTFTTTYRTTTVDLVTGKITNSATVSAVDPSGKPVTGTASVEVNAYFKLIEVHDDVLGPIKGREGGTTRSVLENDTMEGDLIDLGAIILSRTSATGSSPLALNENGTVTIAPNTPAGSYTFSYQVCDVFNPTNCQTATVTVDVLPASLEAASVSADANGYDGTKNVANVFDNIELNEERVDPEDISLTVVRTDPELVLNSDGSVDVLPGTRGGTYILEYRICEKLNPDNCTVATVTITVVNPLKIPNVFTPNGDGKNDTFEIIGVESVDVIEVIIVNRWGNEVYRSNNYRNDWDGRSLGEGTYYYLITTHKGNVREVHKGWVLLKRM